MRSSVLSLRGGFTRWPLVTTRSYVQSSHTESRYPRHYFQDQSNRRHRLQEIQEELELDQPSEWKRKGITMNQIRNRPGGQAVCRHYGDLLELLEDLLPHTNWVEVLGEPNVLQYDSYWRSHPERQRDFIQTLAQSHNLPRDRWHCIPRKQILSAGGKWILREYKSLYEALCHLYPDSILPSWRDLGKVKSKSSLSHVIARTAVQHLLEGHVTEENPYVDVGAPLSKEILQTVCTICQIDAVALSRLSIDDLFAMGLRPVIVHYYTVQDAISSILQVSLRTKTQEDMTRIPKPQKYFDSSSHCAIWLEQIVCSKATSVETLSDLVLLTHSQIRAFGGGRLLQQYGDIASALEALFPSLEDSDREFKIIGEKATRNYWANPKNQLAFMEAFRRHNGITDLVQWQSVKIRDFVRQGGSSLLKYHSGLRGAVQALYPETQEWSDADWGKKPAQFWSNQEKVREFLRTVEKRYCISSPEDWNRISRKQIINSGGSGLLTAHGKLVDVLRFAFPEHHWNESLLASSRKRSQQRMLFIFAQQLLPNVEIVEDFVHPDINRQSSFSVEFDLYIPEHQIAIEYQGEHHYQEIPALGHLELYQDRDREKEKLCQEHGVALILVPYWIDMSLESLGRFFSEIDIPHFKALLQLPTSFDKD